MTDSPADRGSTAVCDARLRWSIVVPVKDLDRSKTRLRQSASVTAELALAFVLDTVTAALDVPGVAEVLIVSSDERVAEPVTRLGASVVADPGGGLNRAVAVGVESAGSAAVAVLTGDLPGLRSSELQDALHQASRLELSLVPDHTGAGTTMLAARSGRIPAPRFGITSRSDHELAGHRVLDVPVDSGLRRDVDTAADLAVLLRSGIGAWTTDTVLRMAGLHQLESGAGDAGRRLLVGHQQRQRAGADAAAGE